MKRTPAALTQTTAVALAQTWLYEYLQQPGKHYTVSIMHDAAQEQAWCLATLKRARMTLPIRVRKELGVMDWIIFRDH